MRPTQASNNSCVPIPDGSDPGTATLLLDLVKPDEALDMPELIERALGEGMPVNVFPILERWFDIGSPEDFQRVLMEFATGEEE